jgi:methyl-accepting chemotaxis protein
LTEISAASREQAAAAAESLEDQARGLAQAVGSFRLERQRALSGSAGSRAKPAALAVAGPRHPIKALPPLTGGDADDEWTEF